MADRARLKELLARKAKTSGPSAFRAGLSGLGQGLSFGFSDEIGSAIGTLAGTPYAEGQARRKADREELRGAHKGIYTGAEIGGAIAPMFIPGVGAVAGGTRAMSAGGRLARVAATGAASGALDAAGRAEGNAIERLPDAALGGGIGLVAAPVADMTLGTLVRRVSERMGRSVGKHAEQEVRRIAEESGMSTDEIVTRIQAGEIFPEMSDTLRAATKSIVVRGGKAGAEITDTMTERSYGRNRAAQDAVERALLPDDMPPPSNLQAAWTQADDAVKASLGQRYERIYGAAGDLPDEVVGPFAGIVRSNRALLEELDDIQRLDGLTSLFDDAGMLTRLPTLKEAERARSVLKEQVDQAYRAGNNTRARLLEEQERTLRESLDNFSPDLAGTRAEYAQAGARSRAFDEGRTMLRKDPEQADVLLSGMGDPEKEAARIGVATGLRGQWTRGKSPLGLVDKLQGEGAEGINLWNILNDQPGANAARGALEDAGTSFRALQGVSPRSDTAGNIAADSRIGVRGDAIADAALQGFNPLSVVQALRRVTRVPMNDATLEQVARVLMSEDPELVRAVLEGRASQGVIAEAIQGAMARTAGAGTSAGLVEFLGGEQQ